MARPAVIGRSRNLLLLVLLVGTAGVLWQNAWVSDDAFITLRTVHNALEGHGLRWNVAERVQSYTHPLWMLLLLAAHSITGEPWFGTLAVGALTSLAAVALLIRGAVSNSAAIAAVLPLLASKAWVDFATSGLENPLTHLLLGLAAWSVAHGGQNPSDLGRTAALCALAMFNRLDALVLFAPLFLGHAVLTPWTRRHLGACILGGLPLLTWLAFSTVYYGTPLPNTAFAKLANGYPITERIGQGLLYAAHLGLHDPISAALVVAAPILALVQRSRLASMSEADSDFAVALGPWARDLDAGLTVQ